MNRNLLYLRYRIIMLVKKYSRKLGVKFREPTTYVGMPIVSLEQAQDYFKERIFSGEPFAVCRFGATELLALWHMDSPFPLRPRVKEAVKRDTCDLAGFFPPEIGEIRKFAEIMRTATGQMDVFCVWFNYMEDYAIDAYGHPKMITKLAALEPWFTEHPWTAALAGKKVLVIHPFRETILRQYERREKLFDNPDYLPEFASLRVVQAVQTIAGARDDRFRDWFEALDWMYNEAMKEDFDIAIIGCGAYGFPLAARLKQAGKQAIHMGGATQLLFGIKGSRWDDWPVQGKLYNEYWVRPSETETPRCANIVEGGCYW